MVVHGPPGTGKTTTLVESIYETLRRENQVLVCAEQYGGGLDFGETRRPWRERVAHRQSLRR